MNQIQFIKENGKVPKSLPGEDHVSGFVMYMPAASLPSGFSTDPIQAISTIEKAESMEITSESTDWYVKVLHYHLSEIFRINPGISLYVGLYTTPASNYDFKEIKAVQNYAEGRIRQVAVYTPALELSSTSLSTLQGVASTLNEEDTPSYILYAGKVTKAKLLTSMASTGQQNVSVVIAQDGDPESVGGKLYQDTNNSTEKRSVTTLGLALGSLSKAAVHESMAWVQKFPSGISMPAFADGTLVKTADKTSIEGLDSKRYLFLIKHTGMAGSFWNDSHTMDEPSSDYAYIELVRTMDKAVRGIRTYLLPYLSGPVYVDPLKGTLSPDTVTFLEQLAGRQLEDMERAGELSGYKVSINPDQDVLSSSTVEFCIEKVSVGVMRKMIVKIGYTKKLN